MRQSLMSQASDTSLGILNLDSMQGEGALFRKCCLQVLFTYFQVKANFDLVDTETYMHAC